MRVILCMSSWNPGDLDFFLKAHIGPVITGSDESVVGENNRDAPSLLYSRFYRDRCFFNLSSFQMLVLLGELITDILMLYVNLHT